jgi:hypothetical protein
MALSVPENHKLSMTETGVIGSGVQGAKLANGMAVTFMERDATRTLAIVWSVGVCRRSSWRTQQGRLMEHGQEHVLALYYYTAINPLASELCS